MFGKPGDSPLWRVSVAGERNHLGGDSGLAGVSASAAAGSSIGRPVGAAALAACRSPGGPTPHHTRLAAQSITLKPVIADSRSSRGVQARDILAARREAEAAAAVVTLLKAQQTDALQALQVRRFLG